MLLAFNKPYGVISQFTPKETGQKTLAEFGFPKKVYPIGRLDLDSEGLLLLSDESRWNNLLLHPRHAHQRTYHVQVEGEISGEALTKLQNGVVVQKIRTKPCRAIRLKNPNYADRNPPIRFRKSVPTSWMEIKLIEGKNRQVRHMGAAVGFPVLRLIRSSIGEFRLGNLDAGKWRPLSEKEKESLLL